MILYFSGTGNSLSVAQKLANNGERVEDMVRYKESAVTEDRVGIVFPVYCFSLPYFVKDFLERVTINADYIFAVATCGGGESKSISNIQYLLQKKDAHLSYGASIVMPDSCIILNNPKTTESLLSKEGERVEKIKNELDSGKTMDIKAIKPYNLATKATWFFFRKILGVDYKKANKNCNVCLKCVKNCPTANIKIENDKIKLGKDCLQCFRCINICPTQAISFGLVKAAKEKQYIHKEGGKLW